MARHSKKPERRQWKKLDSLLAAGVDFLAAVQERGVKAERAAAALEFSFGMGSQFFFQIAKLRAFRMVWARVVESFGGTRSGARARIAARTSRWNKTVYDPHVNILRATTEAMAAVLGGADAVTVAPFDACYKQPDEASRRLARNTQLLLKHEAWMGRVADAGGGSYFIEALTDFLAREGWKRMQEIEARGGYRKAQAEGLIARTLGRSMAAREKAVALRRRVLVGTNQFANPAERALGRVEAARMSETRRGANRMRRCACGPSDTRP
jgi:methylmalonyl-CoA mutase